MHIWAFWQPWQNGILPMPYGQPLMLTLANPELIDEFKWLKGSTKDFFPHLFEPLCLLGCAPGNSHSPVQALQRAPQYLCGICYVPAPLLSCSSPKELFSGLCASLFFAASFWGRVASALGRRPWLGKPHCCAPAADWSKKYAFKTMSTPFWY